MKTCATRYTQKQLAYIAYWEGRGYTFKPGEVVSEDTRIAPGGDSPKAIELLVTGFLLVGAFLLLAWGYADDGLLQRV